MSIICLKQDLIQNFGYDIKGAIYNIYILKSIDWIQGWICLKKVIMIVLKIERMSI